MNKSKFTEILSYKTVPLNSEIKELEEVVETFPYFQAAHILLAKVAHDTGSMLSDKRLKTAAAYTANRKNLKKIINQTFVAEPLTHAIDTASNVLSEPIEHASIEMTVNNPEVGVLPVEESENIQTAKEEEVIENIIDSKKVESETNSEITIEEEKPVQSTSQAFVKDKFFSELQENLEMLKQLKKGAAEGKKINLTPISPAQKREDKKLTEDLINEFLTSASVKEPDLKNRNDINKTVGIENSAIDSVETRVIQKSGPLEIIIQGREENFGGTEPSNTELLMDYLNFLEQERKKLSKQKVDQIIERFIKEDPSIPYLNAASLPDNQEDLTEGMESRIKEPVSENFAKILIIQKKYSKAIDIYHQLSLKNPEKSTYFAGLIEDLKKKYNI